MQIKENISLKPYNTFGIDVQARFFVEITKEADLLEMYAAALFFKYPKYLIIGGGSNMLFTKDYDGLVIWMHIQHINSQVDDVAVTVTAGAGVIWHQLVQYAVKRNYAGIENLSLIPGTVGAAPVQNIGAYGAELKDVFLSCKCFNIAEGEFEWMDKEDCDFGYRDSIFKDQLKGKYIITEVKLKLSTKTFINTSYGVINSELLRKGIDAPNIADVSAVVSSIRVNKLPDPSFIGNSGSFFKNPIVSEVQYTALLKQFSDMVAFPLGNEKVKIAAGWLIEKCGWKGKKIGETGTWKNQALVLVNYGKASGSDVYDLSEAIIQSVKNRFNITLEREVNIIN